MNNYTHKFLQTLFIIITFVVYIFDHIILLFLEMKKKKLSDVIQSPGHQFTYLRVTVIQLQHFIHNNIKSTELTMVIPLLSATVVEMVPSIPALTNTVLMIYYFGTLYTYT